MTLKNRIQVFSSCHLSIKSLKSKILTESLLTVPLLPIERWLSCCVRGPIMEVGWMDIAWSIPGVRTAPCKRT